MPKPCNHKKDEYIENCPICNLCKNNPKYYKLYIIDDFDVTKPNVNQVSVLPSTTDNKFNCVYLGKRIRDENGKIKQTLCTEGCPKGKLLDHYECEIYGDITLQKCLRCPSKVAPSAPKIKNKEDSISNTPKNMSPQVTWTPHKEFILPAYLQYLQKSSGPDQIGIAIGTHEWPNLTELQIRLIKANCGNIPILICDDHSTGCGYKYDKNSPYGKLKELTTKYDKVDLLPNPVRFGHGAGDLSVFQKALTWGKAKDIPYIIKLSRRLLIDVPIWAQYWTHRLIKDTTNQVSLMPQNLENWPIHTHCIIMKTDFWFTVLDELWPINLDCVKNNMYVEKIILGIIKDKLGGIYTPLGLFSKDQTKKNPGVYWHTANTLEEYKKVFKEYDIEMDADFSIRPSGLLPNFLMG